MEKVIGETFQGILGSLGRQHKCLAMKL